LTNIRYAKFVLNEIQLTNITEEIFIDKIKLLNVCDINNNHDVILKCKEQYGIDDEKFCGAILHNYNGHYNYNDHYKCCVDMIKKFKLNFSEYVIDKIIDVSVRIKSTYDIGMLMNENITLSFGNIKSLIMLSNNISQCEENASTLSVFTCKLIQSALDTIKNNNHKHDEYKYFIENYVFFNSRDFDDKLKKQFQKEEFKIYDNDLTTFCQYMILIHTSLKHNFIPTHETLYTSIKNNNNVLKMICMHKNVKPSFECYKKIIDIDISDILSIDYCISHEEIIITEKYLSYACKYSDEDLIDKLLDMKLIPDYECAANCIHNENILKKICQNGLNINRHVTEFFIENHIDKKFLSCVDTDIIFDACQNINNGYGETNNITTSKLSSQELALYKMMIKRETDYAASMSYADEHKIKLNKYHYDVILEFFVDAHNEKIFYDENAKKDIFKALSENNYVITIKSISRIQCRNTRCYVLRTFME
jgi:hypothetical protein